MKWYWWVIFVTLIILGILTLIPAPAGKVSYLGYYAWCSFTPISTIICWAIALLVYNWGRRRAEKS